MRTQAKKNTSRTKKVAKSSRKRSTAQLSVGPAMQAVHETAKGLYRAGVMDRTTMKEFDALCLPKVPAYTPSQIRKIRSRCKASQAVFARCMNVTASALQKWEIGAKKPSSVACKLLHLVEKKGLDILLV